MTFLRREVRVVAPEEGLQGAAERAFGLEQFRDVAAWVLLGEPGAGKTTVFEEEAKATHGVYRRVAEFVESDLKEDWRGRDLFLDGLDEIRAGPSEGTLLQRVRNRLERLGRPRFRLACRAADWFGASDRADIEAASVDGKIVELQLEPLKEPAIRHILREELADSADAFIAQAKRLAVFELLGNPQTLKLITKAVASSHWPSTRQETFDLACAKLAFERNERHARRMQFNVGDVLDAAGQLCAVVLMSNATGIAMIPSAVGSGYVPFESCAPPNRQAAERAVHSNLFRFDAVDRAVPTHRTIAEYLAARWLAKRVDDGLPLGRVLNLLLGADGRTVAGLRGLYAWLALHCRRARRRLIEADPFTVVIYGDAGPMPQEDKRLLLEGLRKESARFAGFRWGAGSLHGLGALASPELTEALQEVLGSALRDRESEDLLALTLDILDEGRPIPELKDALLAVVEDESHWPQNRRDALVVWIEQASPEERLSLLSSIASGAVEDRDDELAGVLLRDLYPEHLTAEALLKHLHTEKSAHHIGAYNAFWNYHLPENAPDEHLAGLLDGLAARPDLLERDRSRPRLDEMAEELLARGLATIGDAVSDERLFGWLGIGVDQHHLGRRTTHDAISSWLGNRPERYKAILALCFSHCAGRDHLSYCIAVQSNRLRNAEPPDDLGLWHLGQVEASADEALALEHLHRVVATLFQEEPSGLTLEQLEAWADQHPSWRPWLERSLRCEVEEWRQEDAADEKRYERQRAEERRRRTAELRPRLAAIAEGTAPVGFMHELAGVWMGQFADVPGDTPAKRFEAYSDLRDLQRAAEAGFRGWPERNDLPSTDAIVRLFGKRREYLAALPCLVGMELRRQDGPDVIDGLPDENLRRMVAFALASGAVDTPSWLAKLARERAELVAEVLVAYARVALRAKREHVDLIYEIERTPDYRAVAALAAPRLLLAFPARARTAQLRLLDHILRTAFRDVRGELHEIVRRKLGARGMDSAQRVHWLIAASLLDPATHERALWRHVGRSEARAAQLADFFMDHHGWRIHDWKLSAQTLGKMIEIIAPHAAISRPKGPHSVSPAMRRGDFVRALINALALRATEDARREVERLLHLPSLAALERTLEGARHELEARIREREFAFASPEAVAQVLANREPVSATDLAALVLDHLDEIAARLRCENDDAYQAFWNVQDRVAESQRDEGLCRNSLLGPLRSALEPLGIDVQPEPRYVNEKRADLRVSCGTSLELPIEIKRDKNPSLWTAPSQQLRDRYSIAPRAHGLGIYLVLWFGGAGMPRPTDGDAKPRSPEELRRRLESTLPPSDRQRIFVRVIDVTWPGRSSSSFEASRAP